MFQAPLVLLSALILLGLQLVAAKNKLFLSHGHFRPKLPSECRTNSSVEKYGDFKILDYENVEADARLVVAKNTAGYYIPLEEEDYFEAADKLDVGAATGFAVALLFRFRTAVDPSYFGPDSEFPNFRAVVIEVADSSQTLFTIYRNDVSNNLRMEVLGVSQPVLLPVPITVGSWTVLMVRFQGNERVMYINELMPPLANAMTLSNLQMSVYVGGSRKDFRAAPLDVAHIYVGSAPVMTDWQLLRDRLMLMRDFIRTPETIVLTETPTTAPLVTYSECLCELGHYQVPGQRCDPCLKDHYCPGMAARPVPCGTGSVTEGVGAARVEQCFCSAGFHGKFNRCTQCRTGQLCLNNSLTPAICPAGAICPDSVTMLPCPPGYFCVAGATEKQECPIGMFCPPGVDAPQECGPNATALLSRSVFGECVCVPGSYGSPPDCTPCDFGHDCDDFNMTAPRVCPAGFYCPTPAEEPWQCPGPFYCPNGTVTPTLSCLEGYHCPRGSSEPKACSSGYCPNNSTVEQVCMIGGITARNLSTSEKDCICNIGFYELELKGRRLCDKCPEDHYCQLNTTRPTHCGPNMVTNGQIGRISVRECSCKNTNFERVNDTCVCVRDCPVSRAPEPTPINTDNNTTVSDSVVIAVGVGGVIVVTLLTLGALVLAKKRHGTWQSFVNSAPGALKRPLSMLVALDRYGGSAKQSQSSLAPQSAIAMTPPLKSRPPPRAIPKSASNTSFNRQRP